MTLRTFFKPTPLGMGIFLKTNLQLKKVSKEFIRDDIIEKTEENSFGDY